MNVTLHVTRRKPVEIMLFRAPSYEQIFGGKVQEKLVD
jgi:hypothetical protein